MKRSIVLLGLLVGLLTGLLVVAGASVPVRAAEVEVVSSFEGNRGPGWKAAANVMGAVGARHVVDFTEGGFTVHDKGTGKVLKHLSQREFWNQVEPARSIDPQKDANDPWMVYDPLSQRWFVTVAGTGPAGTMRPPVVAVKGTTGFKYAGLTATNFSNYSTTCIDPSAGDLLWTYQGYANSTVDRQWCTAWAAFKLPATATSRRATAREKR